MADPVIRLDRSKVFSENRGDMTPEDPFYRVRYWQGGTLVSNGKRCTVSLPFDAQGELVPDDNKPAFKAQDPNNPEKQITYQPLYSQLMREYLAAKKKRVAQVAAIPSNEPTIDEGESETDALAPSGTDDVDLPAWLRGQVEYKPYQVRAAVRERYGHVLQKESEIVVDLVLEEHLVPEAEVCLRLQAYITAYEQARKNAA